MVSLPRDDRADRLIPNPSTPTSLAGVAEEGALDVQCDRITFRSFGAAHVALPPFIILERSRGVVRLAILMLYGLIAAAGVGLAVRARNLEQVPDLGVPFDLAAFRDGGPDDAYPLYLRAIALYQSPRAGRRRTSRGWSARCRVRNNWGR